MVAPLLALSSLLACASEDTGPTFGSSSQPFEGVPIELDEGLAEFYANSEGPRGAIYGVSVSGFLNGDADFPVEIAAGRVALWNPLEPGRTVSTPVTVDEDDPTHIDYSCCNDASELGLDLAVDPALKIIIVQLTDGRIASPIMEAGDYWPEGDNGLEPFTGDLSGGGQVLIMEMRGWGGVRADSWILDPWYETLAGPYDAEGSPYDSDYDSYDMRWEATHDLSAEARSSSEQLWYLMRAFDSDDELYGVGGISPIRL